MKPFGVISACLLAALALAGAASSTVFGVADDTGKYADDGGASFFPSLTDLGMTENRIVVFWDAAHPTLGAVRQVGSPMRLGRTPVREGGAGPRLGEHTDEILAELGAGS